MKARLYSLSLSLVLVAAVAPQAHGFSTGISSGVLGPLGCNSCHVGGTVPTVMISGPTTVTADTSNEYLVTISSPPLQLSAGLSATVDVGDLTVGGAESGMTQIVPSGSGNFDVTHTGAKVGNGSEVLFSFVFDAPATAGPATIDVWGNAVDVSGTTAGDRAAMASLAITVEPGAPIPATNPWGHAALVLLLLSAGSVLALRRRGWPTA